MPHMKNFFRTSHSKTDHLAEAKSKTRLNRRFIMITTEKQPKKIGFFATGSDGKKYKWLYYREPRLNRWILQDYDGIGRTGPCTWIEFVPFANLILENHGMDFRLSLSKEAPLPLLIPVNDNVVLREAMEVHFVQWALRNGFSVGSFDYTSDGFLSVSFE